MFRRGHYFEKRFHKKCVDCGEEYQHEVRLAMCVEGQVRDPDHEELTYVNGYLIKKTVWNKHLFIFLMKLKMTLILLMMPFS